MCCKYPELSHLDSSFLTYYPSGLGREPCGVGVLCRMVCLLADPAFWATWEEVSAAWWSGTHPSLLALEKPRKTGARVEAASLPPSLAGKEIFKEAWSTCLGGRASSHTYFFSLILLQIAIGVFLVLSLCVCAVFKF